jgi:hypothetical protein
MVNLSKIKDDVSAAEPATAFTGFDLTDQKGLPIVDEGVTAQTKAEKAVKAMITSPWLCERSMTEVASGQSVWQSCVVLSSQGIRPATAVAFWTRVVDLKQDVWHSRAGRWAHRGRCDRSALVLEKHAFELGKQPNQKRAHGDDPDSHRIRPLKEAIQRRLPSGHRFAAE